MERKYCLAYNYGGHSIHPRLDDRDYRIITSLCQTRDYDAIPRNCVCRNRPPRRLSRLSYLDLVCKYKPVTAGFTRSMELDRFAIILIVLFDVKLVSIEKYGRFH